MPAYTKEQQLGRKVKKRKKKRNGKNLSKVDEWNRERKTLKKIYKELGITNCEYISAKGVPCHSTFAMSFAHDETRDDLEPGELGSVNFTALLCGKHHDHIEGNAKETKRLFKTIRPIRNKK